MHFFSSAIVGVALTHSLACGWSYSPSISSSSEALLTQDLSFSCISEAPRGLTTEQRLELCSQTEQLGDAPLECANLLTRTRLLGKNPESEVVKFCRNAKGLGAASCWIQFHRNHPFSGPPSPNASTVESLCLNASDARPAECYSKLLQISRTQEHTTIIDICTNFNGSVSDLMACVNNAPSAMNRITKYRLCHAGKNHRTVLNCALSLLRHKVASSSVIAEVCGAALATHHLAGSMQCLNAVQKRLVRWSDSNKAALCVGATSDDPVTCAAILEGRNRYHLPGKLLSSDSIALCKESRNFSRVVECIDAVPSLPMARTFTSREHVQLCAADQTDDRFGTLVPVRCAVRARQLGLLRSSDMVVLCDHAPSLEPSRCYGAVRSRLSVSNAIQLCQAAASPAPQQCFDQIKWRKQTEIAVRLCKGAESSGPARCLNHLPSENHVKEVGFLLCERATDETPALCFRDAPAAFSDQDKAHLCRQALDSHGPLQCARHSVTRLTTTLQQAQLCHLANSKAPVECALQAPFEFKAHELVQLCRWARDTLAAECASVLSLARTRVKISRRNVVRVCARATSITVAHCVSSMLLKNPHTVLSEQLVDECRKVEPVATSMEIMRLAFDCPFLMTNCPVSIKLRVLDQFHQEMRSLQGVAIRLDVTCFKENQRDCDILDPLREDSKLIAVIADGVAAFERLVFSFAGTFQLRFHALSASSVALLTDLLVRSIVQENPLHQRHFSRCNQLFHSFAESYAQATNPFEQLPADHSTKCIFGMPNQLALVALGCEPIWLTLLQLERQRGVTCSRMFYAMPAPTCRFFTKTRLPACEKSRLACLELPENATRSAIRRAYHLKSLEWHPDKWHHVPSLRLRAQANEIFELLTDAYQQLISSLHDFD